MAYGQQIASHGSNAYFDPRYAKLQAGLASAGVTLHRPEMWPLTTGTGCERRRRQPLATAKLSFL